MGCAAPQETLWPSAAGKVLSGDLGVQAVRRLVVDPLAHGVAELLRERFPDDPRPRLALLRTKYKPARKLTAYYRLATGPGHVGDRHLAVSWTTDGATTLLVSPTDPAMPQLGRLTDPRHIAALVVEMSDRPPDSLGTVVVHTVRYRPGQRHVLRVCPAGDRRAIFVKTDRDDSGARAVAVAGELRATLADRCPAAAPAEPLGHSPDVSAALWHEAAGRPLSALLPARDPRTARLVALVGRAARALHDSPAGPAAPPGEAASRTVDTEVTTTLRAGEHLAALLPAVGRTYRGLVAEAAQRVDDACGECATFTHGDLKGDNLVVDGDRLRILDLDRAGWADPALDLGKLLADLRWWCGPDQQHAATLTAAFRTGYGACDPARWARAGALAALFDLRFAARRCAVHDPDWPARVRNQVAVAAATLERDRDA